MITENAEDLGLSLEQAFEKVETTAEDVLVVLETLWRRSSDIDTKARSRVAFHSIVLTGAIGGFRPGTLMNLPYRQVRLAIVRNKYSPTQTSLVATITIVQNKRRTKAIRRSQNNRYPSIVDLFCLIQFANTPTTGCPCL